MIKEKMRRRTKDYRGIFEKGLDKNEGEIYNMKAATREAV